MALTTQPRSATRRAHWLRRPAAVLAGLTLAGAGVVIAPAVAGADQAPAASTNLHAGPSAAEQGLTCLIEEVEFLLGQGPPAFADGCPL
jgi:hypothetical protein